MAFDGITVHALTYELKNILSGGRINKIALLISAFFKRL